MELEDIEKELIKLLNTLELAPDKASDAIATYDNLYEGKKSLLAELFNEQDPSLSDKKREMLAMAEKPYKEVLEALFHANKEAIRAKMRYETLKQKVEVYRSFYSAKNKQQLIL